MIRVPFLQFNVLLNETNKFNQQKKLFSSSQKIERKTKGKIFWPDNWSKSNN